MELILPVLLLVMNGSLMAVLWFGAVEVRDGGVQVGELVAIVNYAMRMTGAFSMFAFIIIAFSRAKASAERMEEVLLANEDLEIHTTESSGLRQLEGDLRFDNVSFNYPGKPAPILDGVSFHVSAGEKLAIMGATGSGKSTLLNLIPRIFEATSGKILCQWYGSEGLGVERFTRYDRTRAAAVDFIHRVDLGKLVMGRYRSTCG